MAKSVTQHKNDYDQQSKQAGVEYRGITASPEGWTTTCWIFWTAKFKQSLSTSMQQIAGYIIAKLYLVG